MQFISTQLKIKTKRENSTESSHFFVFEE